VWSGALTKRIHLGRAAQLGLEAALLAQHGVTGPTTILEGEYGYLHAYSPSPEPERLTDGLGTLWLSDDIFPKPYPTHGTNLPIVAALDTWHQNGGDPSTVCALRLLVSSDAAEPRHMDRAPTTVLGAQYSVPFTSALALLSGADGVRGLGAETLTREDVRAVAASLTIEHDPRFGNKSMRRGAEVHLDLGAEQLVLAGPGLGPVSVAGLREFALRNLSTYAAVSPIRPDTAAISAAAEGLEGSTSVGDLAALLGQ
jgi:2-methylcitrate dehydratase PrpD